MIKEKLKIYTDRILSFNPYLGLLISMAGVILALIIYFGLVEYHTNKNHLELKLDAETKKVERSLVDIIKHTEFIMKMIISQVRTDYKNKDHINNVINKYSINPRLNNVLSWTTFAWFDKRNMKVIDSTSGISTKPIDMSNKEHLKNAKKEPGKMHIGSTSFGFKKQRYIIPTILGVSEDYEYIGALSLDFDLANLSLTLSNQINDENIYMAILDNKLNIIIQSPNSLVHAVNRINPKNVYQFIEEHNIDFEELSTSYSINMFTKVDNHYLHRIEGYPFAIYLHYDNYALKVDFWKDITYRFIEIFTISLVATLIIILIYKREKSLRDKAETASNTAIKVLKKKTEFLAYTAHELRSPLGFIISSSEMISKKIFGEINPQYLEYIKGIKQSSNELLEFIDDLLDEIKFEKGNIILNENIIDVKSIIVRAIKINNVNYNNRINTDVNFDDNLPMLIVDPKILFQIFNNIISNAIKYSPKGSLLTIDVNFHRGRMLISFQDQGYGMSSMDLDETFITNDNTNKKNPHAKSVGLGLHIIRNLVNTMGVKFTINSKIDVGTKIVLTFPKKKVKILSKSK